MLAPTKGVVVQVLRRELIRKAKNAPTGFVSYIYEVEIPPSIVIRPSLEERTTILEEPAPTMERYVYTWYWALHESTFACVVDVDEPTVTHETQKRDGKEATVQITTLSVDLRRVTLWHKGVMIPHHTTGTQSVVFVNGKGLKAEGLRRLLEACDDQVVSIA